MEVTSGWHIFSHSAAIHQAVAEQSVVQSEWERDQDFIRPIMLQMQWDKKERKKKKDDTILSALYSKNEWHTKNFGILFDYI